MRKSEQRETPDKVRRIGFRPWMAGTVALATSLGVFGCSSIHSTHLERARECCGWKISHLKGVPTKLRVPTHLEVKVLETRYAREGGQPNDPMGTLVYLQDETGELLRTHRVVTKIIEKEEIFLVDPVRPAAGLGYSSVTLNANNSVDLLKGKIEDQTIEAITYSLNKLSGLGGSPPKRSDVTLPNSPSASSVLPRNNKPTEIETVVGARWFPLEDPQLEIHVHEFLRERLNGCRPPCSPPHQTEFGADPAKKVEAPHPPRTAPTIRVEIEKKESPPAPEKKAGAAGSESGVRPLEL